MSTEDFESSAKDLQKQLQLQSAQRDKIERQTVEQSECSKWHEIRANRLTASMFGGIVA